MVSSDTLLLAAGGFAVAEATGVTNLTGGGNGGGGGSSPSIPPGLLAAMRNAGSQAPIIFRDTGSGNLAGLQTQIQMLSERVSNAGSDAADGINITVPTVPEIPTVPTIPSPNIDGFDMETLRQQIFGGGDGPTTTETTTTKTTPSDLSLQDYGSPGDGHMSIGDGLAILGEAGVSAGEAGNAAVDAIGRFGNMAGDGIHRVDQFFQLQKEQADADVSQWEKDYNKGVNKLKSDVDAVKNAVPTIPQGSTAPTPDAEQWSNQVQKYASDTDPKNPEPYDFEKQLLITKGGI